MSAIDDVKARLDIVETVGRYVPELKRSGRTFKAACPFHTERTPSFIVDPGRGSWHCFGACSTGGDVIEFVRRIEGLEFREALSRCADLAGIELRPPLRAGAPRAGGEREAALGERGGDALLPGAARGAVGLPGERLRRRPWDRRRDASGVAARLRAGELERPAGAPGRPRLHRGGAGPGRPRRRKRGSGARRSRRARSLPRPVDLPRRATSADGWWASARARSAPRTSRST